MSTEQQQLEAVIAGLEAQRALLGDALVDASLAPLRAKLAAISGRKQTPQTLKQVTVLFLDIVGSTTLSRQLDPEDIQAVMDGALSAFTNIIDAHEGRVLQYAGDSLLAAFGADESQEDDVERAIHAGLALCEEGSRLSLAVKERHGHDGFAVRVGVHTGGVLLGGGVDEDGTIRGIPVNIAARMEQTAPPGRMRISHDTYRHVRGVFDVEPQEPLPVKGIAEPMLTYLVVRAKPRAFRVMTRGIEGIETRMIGRDAELARLQDAFARLYRDEVFIPVMVIAEAGIGKSRLLYEFQNWAESRAERFYIFQGRANPQTQRQPYGLLRDVLAWRLQIADSDPMDEAKQKLEDGIIPLFIADDGEEMARAHAHILGHLIGLDFSDSRHVRGIRDDGKQIRARGFHAAAQMFRRVAARNRTPIVFLLDDLHWADDGTLDFFNYMVQVNRDVPILSIGLTRPTLFERRPEWRKAPGIARIELTPLDKSVSRELANELLKNLVEIPAALRELVTGGAEGNPFYMEELVKMLIDEGAIDTSGTSWVVRPDRLLATHVPQTLTGVLQARLDGLRSDEKHALQQASVIGFVFWEDALGALDAEAPAALPSLVQRELAVPRTDAVLEDVHEYAFRHQILHQVTYDTLLKRARREAHARVAAWLAALRGARANDFLGIAAEHFEKGGDPDHAIEYFARAAEHAATRYGHEGALGYVAQALALIGDQRGPARLPILWRLIDVRERTLEIQARRDEQRADIDRLAEIAEALDDDLKRGEVAMRRSTLALRTSSFRAMEHAAREAMAIGQRLGAIELELRAQQRLATAMSCLGRTDEAEALVLDGLAATRAAGLRAVEGLLLNSLGNIAGQREDLVALLETGLQALVIDREISDPRREATTLANIGVAWLSLGQSEQARNRLEESLKLARAIGYRAIDPALFCNLSVLSLWQGDPERAVVHARAALDVAVEVQGQVWEAIASFRLGNAELALGRHDAATAAFARVVELSTALGNGLRHDASAGLARVALAANDVGSALAGLRDLLVQLERGEALEGVETPSLVRLTAYRVLERAGDGRAEAILATAHRLLIAKADAIDDEALKRSFLNAIPEHRDIVFAWNEREATEAA